ncbi:MAG: winged helix-turn-helix transcriptional regulator [Sulfolobus sp.]|nr:winged helix-turn-helix transcriptional regulator [Sulfolobus sp.]
MKKFIEFLETNALTNSVRLAILLSLFALGHLTFSEIVNYLNQPKSSVSAHIQVLEERELIKVSKQLTAKGPRVVIGITDKGKDTVRKYFLMLEELRRLGFKSE